MMRSSHACNDRRNISPHFNRNASSRRFFVVLVPPSVATVVIVTTIAATALLFGGPTTFGVEGDSPSNWACMRAAVDVGVSIYEQDAKRRQLHHASVKPVRRKKVAPPEITTANSNVWLSPSQRTDIEAAYSLFKKPQILDQTLAWAKFEQPIDDIVTYADDALHSEHHRKQSAPKNASHTKTSSPNEEEELIKTLDNYEKLRHPPVGVMPIVVLYLDEIPTRSPTPMKAIGRRTLA